MKVPPYPRYKRSGVEWLGDVPEHWQVKRSDAIVSADRSQLSREAFADQEVFHYSIPVVQEIGTGQVENGESIASAKQVIKKPVVLVSKLNPRKATICLAKPQALLTLCSTEFVALNADNCELAFLEYLTRSELFRQGLDSKVQSVTRSHQRANPADIYKFWNAWPTLKDQRAIAAFLDRETDRVDRLVAKKRELIERLKEKRTALISRVVTRGLPPAAARAAGLTENPTLKPSSVDWLGDIPAHWLVKPFRHLIVGGTRNGLYKSTEFFDPDGTPMVQMGEAFESPTINRSADDRVRLTKEEKDTWGLQPNDVLFARRSLVFEGSGKCSIVGDLPELHVFESSLIRVRPNPNKISPPYLFWFLRSNFSRSQILASAKQVTISGIDSQQLKSISILIPSSEEQRAIAEYLDTETGKLDAMVATVEEAIERLQEYRSALITAAVTGKIDVRKAVTT